MMDTILKNKSLRVGFIALIISILTIAFWPNDFDREVAAHSRVQGGVTVRAFQENTDLRNEAILFGLIGLGSIWLVRRQLH